MCLFHDRPRVGSRSQFSLGPRPRAVEATAHGRTSSALAFSSASSFLQQLLCLRFFGQALFVASVSAFLCQRSCFLWSHSICAWAASRRIFHQEQPFAAADLRVRRSRTGSRLNCAGFSGTSAGVMGFAAPDGQLGAFSEELPGIASEDSRSFRPSWGERQPDPQRRRRPEKPRTPPPPPPPPSPTPIRF